MGVCVGEQASLQHLVWAKTEVLKLYLFKQARNPGNGSEKDCISISIYLSISLGSFTFEPADPLHLNPHIHLSYIMSVLGNLQTQILKIRN